MLSKQSDDVDRLLTRGGVQRLPQVWCSQVPFKCCLSTVGPQTLSFRSLSMESSISARKRLFPIVSNSQ
jgi:hypothetical protein